MRFCWTTVPFSYVHKQEDQEIMMTLSTALNSTPAPLFTLRNSCKDSIRKSITDKNSELLHFSI